MDIKLKVVIISLILIILLGGLYWIGIERSFNNQLVFVLDSNTYVKFRIDSTFSDEEKKDIRKALRDWEKAAAGLIKLEAHEAEIPLSEIYTWRGDGVATIYQANSLTHWPTHLMLVVGNHHLHLGMTMIYTGDIFMLSDDRNIFRSVVAHEIGHVLIGAYHSKNPNDLMYHLMGDQNKDITDNDVSALKRAIEERK